MPFVAEDYRTNPAAPEGQWVSTRISGQGPFKTAPAAALQGAPHFGGQCVSYVTRICPTLPVGTRDWRKGDAVRNNGVIKAGTVIATFNAQGRYEGHAAIYESQDAVGIHVYDQWVSGTPKPIGPRRIRWDGTGVANCGDLFHVVEPA